jgi:hypothetical protein
MSEYKYRWEEYFQKKLGKKELDDWREELNKISKKVKNMRFHVLREAPYDIRPWQRQYYYVVRVETKDAKSMWEVLYGLYKAGAMDIYDLRWALDKVMERAKRELRKAPKETMRLRKSKKPWWKTWEPSLSVELEEYERRKAREYKDLEKKYKKLKKVKR